MRYKRFDTHDQYNDWQDAATAAVVRQLTEKYGDLFAFDEDGDPVVIPEAECDYTAAMDAIHAVVPVYDPDEVKKTYTRAMAELHMVAQMYKDAGSYTAETEQNLAHMIRTTEDRRIASLAVWAEYAAGRITAEE